MIEEIVAHGESNSVGFGYGAQSCAPARSHTAPNRSEIGVRKLCAERRQLAVDRPVEQL